MTDRAAEAVAELYGADPDEFTTRRGELAKAARAAGDADAAKRIAALRKPTRPAWLVNRLVRALPEVPARLAELADGLRDAERARDGARLRELSAARSALIDEFTKQALTEVDDPPFALREDVSATLGAAIADPAVAADLAAGTLTRAEHWAGFGLGTGLAPAPETEDMRPGGGTKAPTRPRAAAPARAGARDAERIREAERAAALREAEERNRRNQKIQDAERGVANASTILSSAAASEERLEEQVRDLEQRLTAARAELSDARLRARRAEAAERKARQALDRLRGSQQPGRG